MKNTILHVLKTLNRGQSVILLCIRLVLAYGFYLPARLKWQDMNSIIQWFTELGIPFPHVNAYLAASTEAAGVLLLTLGLGTRLIAVPLGVTMLVAIKTVHWSHGFEAGNNGFEIPLYYLCFLMLLMSTGPGALSFDAYISKKFFRTTKKDEYREMEQKK